MAIWLFRQIRGKVRENQAKKAVPTTDDSNLVPEAAQTSLKQQKFQQSNFEQGHGSSKLGQINAVTPEEIARSKEETRQRRARQWKLMLGLLLPNFLAAME